MFDDALVALQGEQEGPSFPVRNVPLTAAWTPVFENRNHRSPSSEPTDLQELAFRMHASNCGGGSTARLYVIQQHRCIFTVKLDAGWCVASPAAHLSWFSAGEGNFPGAAAFSHPEACRTPLRAGELLTSCLVRCLSR
jgi:hypothetical protein